MSPLEARRAVGHPDIVERLRDEARFGWHLAANRQADTRDLHAESACEVERLRCTLRAVRGSSDPAWAARLINDALGES